MALECRHIPRLPGLESIRLRGGFAGADTRVRWPYVAEDRSFRNWIRGGELVFVTGISRHRDPGNLAECLYEGKQCNIAGLVVLTGDAYIGQLPTRLCQLADELGLPLFEQPWSLPMVTVTETIARAILEEEHRSDREPATTLARALVLELGPERIEELVGRYLAVPPGVEDGALLESWVAHRGNQSAMAEALGCHRNTVRNRLQKLLGEHPGGTETDQQFRTLLLSHLLTDGNGKTHRQPEKP